MMRSRSSSLSMRSVLTGVRHQKTALVAFGLVDGVIAGFDADAAEVVAVDGVELPVDERRGGVAETAGEDVLEVLAEQVVVAALAALGEGGVVGFEPVDAAVVGDADEQGAAVLGVEEPGDGLDDEPSRGCRSSRPDVPAQRGLVLQVGVSRSGPINSPMGQVR
jgi:hypothetical protein